MKRWFLFCTSLFLFLSAGMAQEDGTLAFEDSDPEALNLLDDMKSYLESLDGFRAKFDMSLMAPGTDTLHYKGTLDQIGHQYHIDVTDYKIISDGSSRWVYYRDANEANLYSDGDSDDSSSPLAYLKMYESGDFVIRLADEYATPGQRCVELKPVDRISEYLKVRLTLRQESKAPERIEVFEKGGTRTDLNILELSSKTNFPRDHFIFKADDHPGVHVEDLRID